jgi:hypothetical protein
VSSGAQLDRAALARNRSAKRPWDSGSRTAASCRERELEHRARSCVVAGAITTNSGRRADSRGRSAVVRRPVGPGQARAVEHERDRQVLQRDLLEDLVVRALQEGAVDVDDRPQAALACPAANATACDSQMPVSKNRSGNVVAHLAPACCPGTWRRSSPSRARSSRICSRIASRRDVRVRRADARLLHPTPSPRRSNCGGAWNRPGRLGGRLEAVPLFGHDVQQHRPLIS